MPCDTHFTDEKTFDIDEIEIDGKKWAITDYKVTNDEESEDEKILINEDIKVTELAPQIFTFIRR